MRHLRTSPAASQRCASRLWRSRFGDHAALGQKDSQTASRCHLLQRLSNVVAANPTESFIYLEAPSRSRWQIRARKWCRSPRSVFGSVVGRAIPCFPVLSGHLFSRLLYSLLLFCFAPLFCLLLACPLACCPSALCGSSSVCCPLPAALACSQVSGASGIACISGSGVEFFMFRKIVACCTDTACCTKSVCHTKFSGCTKLLTARNSDAVPMRFRSLC